MLDRLQKFIELGGDINARDVGPGYFCSGILCLGCPLRDDCFGLMKKGDRYGWMGIRRRIKKLLKNPLMFFCIK